MSRKKCGVFVACSICIMGSMLLALTFDTTVADDVDVPVVFSLTLRDDAGNPVPGAKVTIRNAPWMHCGMIKVKTVETTTDEQGRASFRIGFRPVYFLLQSEAGSMTYPGNHYYPGERLPPQLLKQREHDLVLMRWAEVSGKVVDHETGEPITAFRGHFKTAKSHAPRSYESNDGSFVNPKVTPGTHIITIMARGYAPALIFPVRVAPASKVDIGVVRMTSGPSLKGRVLSAKNGEPLPGAVIRFRSPSTGYAVVSSPPDRLTATTDANGRFSVANMPALPLQLYTTLKDPEHRSVVVGEVDMSLARKGLLEAEFFADF